MLRTVFRPAILASPHIQQFSTMAATDIRVVLMTVPSDEVGKSIARELVSKKLIACANIVPQVTSIYSWNDEVNEDSENLVVMKTQVDRVDELTAAIKALHPYDVPEVIALPVSSGLESYMSWVREQTTPSAQ